VQHKIGIDYSSILTQRKTKRELPLVAKLHRSVNILALQKEIGALLELKNRSKDQDFATFDPASSEHNYHLKNTRGESFIRNYDEFYQHYSTIGFQELSDEARLYAGRLNYLPSDLSPVQRLKGMKNTSYEKYHPHYDERNYTKATRFFTDEVARTLNSFQAEVCRSALVCLRPDQFISSHFDIGPEYITRTMIPVFTNPQAVVGVRSQGGYCEFHLPADGGIYLINSGLEHYAVNWGSEPRFQIRVCLNGQDDLEQMTALDPVRFISDKDFASHPCAIKAAN
jgi:hypothetical protein